MVKTDVISRLLSDVWEATAGGFPALSPLPGQLLINGLALLGISLWTIGEAWKADMRSGLVR